MRFESVRCSEATAEKLAVKHGVDCEEAEEVLWSSRRIRFQEKGTRQGQDLYFAAGQTDAGRYLIVFFIFKPATEDNPAAEAMIVSARAMTEKERKQYERK